jgi:uncharacterized FAD-dependent dehydrogenase
MNSDAVHENMLKQGIKVLFNFALAKIDKIAIDQIVVQGNNSQTISTEKVILATGRSSKDIIFDTRI